MLFKDISNFNNVNDYLHIFNGCLNADLLFMFLLYHGAVKSKMLKQWYKKFTLSAVIADVFILIIGIIITRYIYKYFFNEFSIFLVQTGSSQLGSKPHKQAAHGAGETA